MPIFDLSQNGLQVEISAQLIGFTEPVPEAETLNLRMYDFLIQPIRTEDNLRGNLFVKRFLEGPQTVWKETQESIFAVKDLWDADRIPDRFLKFLKNILGWTSELDSITDRLDDRQLRQLIRASGVLWKTRGPEASIQNILRQLTGTRLRLWNWFDFRWIVDETGTGEEHDGRDPWMIGTPGEGLEDEHRFNIRIVDDGTLDRILVSDIAKLMRPVGERIEVSFISFLDLFLVDEDTEQWEAAEGTFIVSDGNMNLTDSGADQKVITIDDNSPDWADIVCFWRAKGSTSGGDEFGGYFNYLDVDNNYSWGIDFTLGTISINKIIAGTPSVVDVVTFASIPLDVFQNIFYGIRVESILVGGVSQIKLFIDNIQAISTTDPDLIKGNIGAFSETGTNAQFDEMEMFQVPLQTTEIGINS
jgi:phage tail-like protein